MRDTSSSRIGTGRSRRGTAGRRIALLFISSFPLGACSSSQLGAHKPLDVPSPGGALLTVVNDHIQDMRIYLLRGTTPIPLGSVTSAERRTFVLPTSMIGHTGALQLIADPLGDRNVYRSDVIPAGRGDLVEWRLAPRLPLSVFSVRQMGRL